MPHETKPRPFLSLVVVHRRAAKIGDLLRSLIAPHLGLLHVDELVLVHTGPDDKDEATRQAREAIRAWLLQSIPVIEAEYRCVDEVEIEGSKYIGDFGRAREFAHGLASGQWTMYLDADDVLDMGEVSCRLSEWVDGLASEAVVEEGMELPAISLPYFYGPDMQHLRTRIWNEGYAWKWIGRIHEERRPVDGSISSVLQVDADDYPRVVHSGDPAASLARNEALVCGRHPVGSPRGIRTEFVCGLPRLKTHEIGTEAGGYASDVAREFDDAVAVEEISLAAAAELLRREDTRPNDVFDLARSLLSIPAHREVCSLSILAAAALLSKVGSFEEAIRIERLAARVLQHPDQRAAGPFLHWIDRAHRALGDYLEPEEVASEGVLALVRLLAKRGDPEMVRRLLACVPPEVCGAGVRQAVAYLSLLAERVSLLSPKIEKWLNGRMGETWKREWIVADNEPLSTIAEGELAHRAIEADHPAGVIFLHRAESFVSPLEPFEAFSRVMVGVRPHFVQDVDGVLVTAAELVPGPARDGGAVDVLIEGYSGSAHKLFEWVRSREAAGAIVRVWDARLRVCEESVPEPGLVFCAGERFLIERVEREGFIYHGPPARLAELARRGKGITHHLGESSPEGRWAPVYLLADRVVVKGEPDVERFLSLYKGTLLDRARSLVSLNLA